MVHDVLRDERVVDHGIVLHSAEAALLLSAVNLLFHQGALQEVAHLLQGAPQVL